MMMFDVLLTMVFFTDDVILLLIGMHRIVWIDIVLHCLKFCPWSLRDLSGSMSQKTFLFSRINWLICCASALWFVTVFLLCLIFIL